MKLADLFIGKRLFVGCGKPAALGKGEEEIRGSAYAEGPVQIGTDSDFSSVDATLMVGHEYNTDSTICVPILWLSRVVRMTSVQTSKLWPLPCIEAMANKT